MNGEKNLISSGGNLFRAFASFGALEAFATNTSDAEILGKIATVKVYKHRLLSVIPKIQSRQVKLLFSLSELR